MYKNSDREIQVGYRVKNCDVHDYALVQTCEPLENILLKGLSASKSAHRDIELLKGRIVFACSDPYIADSFSAFLTNKPIKVKPKMRPKFRLKQPNKVRETR